MRARSLWKYSGVQALKVKATVKIQCIAVAQYDGYDDESHETSSPAAAATAMQPAASVLLLLRSYDCYSLDQPGHHVLPSLLQSKAFPRARRSR